MSTMKAIVCTKPGGLEVLEYADVAAPQLKAGHVLINVKATALNGADQLQMQGKYPPPEGAHHIVCGLHSRRLIFTLLVLFWVFGLCVIVMMFTIKGTQITSLFRGVLW
jgi:hypothetical protein